MELNKKEEELILSMREIENKQKEVDALFKFYDKPSSDNCDFANGEWNIQRSKEFYNKFLDTLIDALEKYEPWIKDSVKMYKDGFSRENIRGYSFIGRLLDDGGSPLMKWWSRQSCICPGCYIEHGQTYHQLHCTHTYKPKPNA